MTATDELRRLLDERGVEWWKPVQMEGSEYTRWHDANGMEWTTSEIHGSRKLRIGASFITPEQAIAATLGDSDATATRQGVGTCHMTRVEDEKRILHGWIECSECGPVYPPAATAIQDAIKYCPYCGRKVVDE